MGRLIISFIPTLLRYRAGIILQITNYILSPTAARSSGIYMVELSNYILVEYYNEEVTDEEWVIVDKRSDWQQKAGNISITTSLTRKPHIMKALIQKMWIMMPQGK